MPSDDFTYLFQDILVGVGYAMSFEADGHRKMIWILLRYRAYSFMDKLCLL